MIARAFMYKSGNITYTIPVTLYNSNTTEDKVAVSISGSNIKLFVGSAWNTTWTKVIVLEYTKTTD